MTKNIKTRVGSIYGKGIALKNYREVSFLSCAGQILNDVLWLKRLKIRVYSKNVFDRFMSVFSKEGF